MSGRIRWKCRRGMLELDFLFERFYDRAFHHLTEEEQHLFDQLLDEADPVLYEWVLGHVSSEHSPYHSLIQKIQSHSHTDEKERN